MIYVHKLFLKLLKLLINLLFIIQIALIILIFLTATYWFFDLMGSNLFKFAEPIANYIIDFIKLFYNRDIVAGGVFIDGSLLLFDIIALAVIFLLSKLKYYLYISQDFFIREINKCKQKIEKEFNKQLKAEAENVIKQYTQAAILITFEAKDLKVDRFWGGDSKAGVKETEQYIVELFCDNLSKMKDITFRRGGKKIVIYIKYFDKVDAILNYINNFIEYQRSEMRNNRWALDYYCAVATYSDGANIEQDILPLLENLLKIKQKNEIICIGSFSLRYSLKEKPLFYGLRLKGAYSVAGGSDIYYLVKNNEEQN